MIYLLDDTSESYTTKYIDCLQYKDVLNKQTSLSFEHLQKIEDMLEKADCIMIHRSFVDEGESSRNDVFEKVIYDIADSGNAVPLVVFSDGDSDTPDFKSKRCIRAFKKSKFYENLGIFLEEFRNTGTINLATLAYGNKSEATQATDDARAILSRIMFKKGTEILNVEDVSGEDFKRLVQRSSPGIGCRYSDIMEEVGSGKLTVGVFRDRIRDIINSFITHGKNIRTWQ